MNRLSVVIKAYNEAERIDEAIASALALQDECPALRIEVVVADGRSTDGTAERAALWARHAPVRVVQLRCEGDRNCGAGMELGFRASRGDWVLFMDADMTLQAGFVKPALEHLHLHPGCAGVAGVIEDVALRNGTDRIRERQGLSRVAGPEPWLNGGGLYRRTALIDAGGYAADHRLAAFEEADLGMRLARAGWTVQRLPQLAVRHQGHLEATWQVLANRWRQGRFEAAGRLLRLHGYRPAGGRAWRLLAHPLVLGLLWCWTLAGWWVATDSPALALSGPALMLTGATGHLVMKRDWSHASTAWTDWHLLLLGIVLGLLRPLPARKAHLPCRVLADGAPQAYVNQRQLQHEEACA